MAITIKGRCDFEIVALGKFNRIMTPSILLPFVPFFVVVEPSGHREVQAICAVCLPWRIFQWNNPAS